MLKTRQESVIMGQDFHVCQTKPGGVQQAGGFIISGVQRATNAMEHCITKRPALQLLLGIQHQHTDILRAADEIGRARAAQLVPGAEAPQNAAARKPGIAGCFNVHAAVPHIKHLLRSKAESGANAVHKMRVGLRGGAQRMAGHCVKQTRKIMTDNAFGESILLIATPSFTPAPCSAASRAGMPGYGAVASSLCAS